MKVKIVLVDFELPRRIAAAIAPLCLLVLFGSTVDAAPTTFAPGETLSATKLNGAFADADRRLVQLESRVDNAGHYSVGAVFCGATLGSTTGDMSGLGGDKGYAGAKTACQTTCDKSPTAHMCTSDEVVRSAALAIAMKAGWYATGEPYASDCAGFTSATVSGTAWHIAPVASPALTSCSLSLPVLCCDAR
jgi:hypothetical protein